MMMTGYEFKEFFNDKAEEARENMDTELGALYARMAEYSDGNAKLLTSLNQMSGERMLAMLSDNLDFEEEFYPASTVNTVHETLVTMFDE